MATRPTMFDQPALIAMMAEASAKQSTQVRQAVHDATLKALQGRELTIQNIRSALKSVTQATSKGAAASALPAPDMEAMLQSAMAGMDDALLRAVEAQRVAVSKMMEQGGTMQDTVLKQALDTVEKMEDALFKAVGQGAAGASAQVSKQWGNVLEKMQMGGTGTGAQATQTVEQFASQMQDTMRKSRAASVQAASAFAQSWGALASGVLIGLSDALQQAGTSKPTSKPKR